MRYGVYVHIPFCRQKCFYCDFPSWAGKEQLMCRYVRALCAEVRAQGAIYVAKWGKPATIYVGGGTPTALPEELMAELLASVRQTFGIEKQPKSLPLQGKGDREAVDRVTPQTQGEAFLLGNEEKNSQNLDLPEFTVEANPGTVDAAYLKMLRAAGVNRLSFGVQSFDDRLLKKIGRIHTGEQAREAVRLAKAAGFLSISLDLMYGLPGQTLLDLQASVREALALCPQHISIYGLQLEPGTAFAKMQEQGRLALPNDAATEDMYDYMTAALPAAGFSRYEISNFARQGFESRHNLGYWQDVPYLGLGAAAHSYLENQRYENLAGIEAYCAAIEQGKSPRREEEEATRAIQMEEFAFLALRTAAGIDKARFAAKFGVELEEIYAPAIKEMKQKGLLAATATHVFLTELGMKYGNWVFEAFLLEEKT